MSTPDQFTYSHRPIHIQSSSSSENALPLPRMLSCMSSRMLCFENVLQCVAVCCSVLQCVAVIMHIMFRKCVAVCCGVLRCVAVCCGVLRWVILYCTGLQWGAAGGSGLQCAAVCCSVLQCVAACCRHSMNRNTLHHTETHCNTLQHIATENVRYTRAHHKKSVAKCCRWRECGVGCCCGL